MTFLGRLDQSRLGQFFALCSATTSRLLLSAILVGFRFDFAGQDNQEPLYCFAAYSTSLGTLRQVRHVLAQ